MEENKVKKINLSTFFLILALIAIVVMAIYIYKLYNEKIEANEKSTELQTQVNNLNTNINDLQGKLNNISNTITSNNSNENTTTENNSSTSFTDNQVIAALSNYLELQEEPGSETLLEKLKEKGKLNYDSSKNTILNDGTVVTSIKFSDYKNAMLNYMSESEFEKNWTSTKYIKENSNGYLTTAQGGGGLRTYTINSISKNNDSTYSAKTTATLVDLDNSKENENFTFTVTSYKGNCVINSFK